MPWSDFCCPGCRGSLVLEDEAYRCPACERRYPILFGIPDFRLVPDPYISFEEEYRKARRLAAEAERLSFEEMVRFYWEITPDVPRALADRYVRYAVSGEERGTAALETMDGHLGRRWSGDVVLEIGCGTGGFLLAARQRFRVVVGADIALRWLVVTRRRLAAADAPITLVCCSATRLPFPDRAFDGVVGLHVLEHAEDQPAVLAEAARTLRRGGGVCVLATPNRWSLGPEPCVRVWGVGFVPRALAARYVWLLKGVPYRHIRLLSYLELRRLLARSGLREWVVFPPPIAECELRTLSGLARVLARLYQRLRRLPGFSLAFRLFGPILQVVARA